MTYSLMLLSFVNIIHAQRVDPAPGPTQSVTCRPFGACEPCPHDAVRIFRHINLLNGELTDQ